MQARFAAALLISPIFCAPVAAIAAPSDLDASFGRGGIARVPSATRVGSGVLFANGGLAMIVDRPTDRYLDDVVIGLTAAGQVDAGFAPILPVAGPESYLPVRIASLAVTRGDQLMALHYHLPWPFCTEWLTRHLRNGSPDASFGHAGVSEPVPRFRGCAGPSLAVDSMGRGLYASGTGFLGFAATWITRFDSAGLTRQSLASASWNDSPDAYHFGPIAIQADDQPVALAGSGVARLAGNGLDATFGSGGVARLDVPELRGLDDVRIAPDGRIVVAGTALLESGFAVVVARLTSRGQLDATFGLGGIAYIDVARRGETITRPLTAVQADGRILIAATVQRVVGGAPYPRIVVARLTVDGKPDASFAPGGITDFWQERGAGFSFLILRPDGRIVIGGTIWKAYTPSAPVTEAVVLQFKGGDLATAKPLRERTAVEYAHVDYPHYFITTDPEEIASLDTRVPAAWVRTGLTFNVWDESDGTLAPVCRFWSGASFAPKSSHFYSSYAGECAAVAAGTVWTFERNAFFLRMPEGSSGSRTCADGSQPLHRAYNGGATGAPNHRYTTDAALLDEMIAQGWQFEGEAQTRVFACVPQRD